MSLEFAERFWYFANDNGGQPKRRLERPGITAADRTGNFRFPRALCTKHSDALRRF